MKITIKTIGNPGLYRSLRKEFDSETKHRSIGGAASRLAKIAYDSRTWARTTGHWGTVEIYINGEEIPAEDNFLIHDGAEDDDMPIKEMERVIGANLYRYINRKA